MNFEEEEEGCVNSFNFSNFPPFCMPLDLKNLHSSLTKQDPPEISPPLKTYDSLYPGGKKVVQFKPIVQTMFQSKLLKENRVDDSNKNLIEERKVDDVQLLSEEGEYEGEDYVEREGEEIIIDVRSIIIEFKPSRRKNTGFSPISSVPVQFCSAPYKYILRITHPLDDGLTEGDFGVFLTGFDTQHVEKGKLNGGIEFEYLRSTCSKTKQVHYYHVQYTLTSFLNQNEKYKLNVCAGDQVILTTDEFLLVARKNKALDDRFWGNHSVKKTKKKKRKRENNTDINTSKTTTATNLRERRKSKRSKYL